MNNINWNIIIKLKDFSEYFCNKDLIQLSMSCKKSREVLTKEVFNTFNLLSFTSSKDYSSLIFKLNTDKYSEKFYTFTNPYKPLTSGLTRSKKRFSNDLKLLNKSINKFVVNDYQKYRYLLNEIPCVFPNITTLVLNDSMFTLNALQSLFDNFKYLEKLELTCNLILHDERISGEYTFNYPISLTSLKLHGNNVGIIYDKVNSIVRCEYVRGLSMHQHIPNLISFDYIMMDSSLASENELFEFIRLNPQLKYLKLSGDQFYFELFNILRNSENLTHLKLDCIFNLYDLKDYNFPSLIHIKYLHLESYYDEYNSFLMKRFPYVTKLVLGFDGNYNRKVKWFIEHFGVLKNLRLITKREISYTENFTINEVTDLEKIDIEFSYKNGSFDPIYLNIKNCRKLKLITFTKNASHAQFENSKDNQNVFIRWRYLYFPHKLAYHI
jgi:hypothetical protein